VSVAPLEERAGLVTASLDPCRQGLALTMLRNAASRRLIVDEENLDSI
jgi:hypothetical protein